MKKYFVSLCVSLLLAATGCQITKEESSDVSNLRPPRDEKPTGDLVSPTDACTADINEFGFPSGCGCPKDYSYSSIIGKCTLSTRICSKALVPMFHPASKKCRVAGDGCAASDWATAGWRRKQSGDTCAPGQPSQNGGKKVAGFDFKSLKVLDQAPLDQVCPAVVNAAEEACQNVGGMVQAATGCVALCSQPIAPKGKVAGYNFAGPRVAAAMPQGTACPQVANAETDACIDANGDTTREKGCKTLCSKPISKKGKVAGFDFNGFKIAEALSDGTACPQVADAVTDACIDASGDTTYTKGCGVLCSVPIAK